MPRSHRPGRPRPAARRPAFRPLLETLEDRLAPALLTVNTLADNTTADNSLSLREAVRTVNNGSTSGLSSAEMAQISGTLGSNDTIQFSLPSGPQTLTLTGGVLNLTRNVTVNGPGAANLTISGNNAGRVFLIGGSSQNLSLVVSLSGLTVASGKVGSSNYGGGLLNYGTLTVTNCTIANNTAGTGGGGGIYNAGALTLNGCSVTSNAASGYGGGVNATSASTLSVSNCTFTGNTTSGSYKYGGGLINSSTSTTTPSVVSNCTFSNNSSTGSGGGLFNDTGAAQLTVSNCTFSGNHSSADGGGVDNDGNSLTVTDCTFSGNTAASDGGGLQDWLGTLSLRNSTFSGNTAAYGGGVTLAGPMQVVNCTITGNRATGNAGGGIYYDSSHASGKVYNTVVAGNYQGTSGTTPGDIEGTLAAGSAFNLVGTGGSGGLSNGVNGNQVGVSNPGLGALANNGGPTQTIALLAGSPAIDHGGNAYVNGGETDQRGFTRIVNGTVDVGAFEVQTLAAPAAPSGLAATAAANGTQVDLTWTDNSSNETGFKVYKSTDGTNFTLLATTGANATSYSWTAASPGTSYSFRVTAYNGAGESAASNTATATTPAAPAAPSSLAATAAANGTQVNLTWTDNSNNETGFKVYKSTDGTNFTLLATAGAGATSYSWTGASPGTSYSFYVTAYNAVGESAHSNTATATTPTAPAAPSSLTAAAAANGTQVNLTWADNANNETGFKVYESTDGTNFTQVATAGAGATAYSWTGASPGTSYSFRVTAYNAVGESAASNTATATTPTAPAVPSGLAATAVSGNQVNLSWADNSSNETGFKVYESTDGTNFALLATVGANATSYSWTAATPATAYSFRVTAYNAVGESAASNTATATTPGLPPAAPSSLAATAAVNGTEVDLAWADNSNNETGFKVYESTDGVNFVLLATAGTNATTYSWTGASPGTAYSFRVTAYNAAGESAASNTATATTPTAPAAPSNLTAAAANGTEVDLTWTDNSTNETSFKVYYSTDGVNFTLLATTGASATSYSWTTASPGTTYSFRVTAANAVGESAASNTATVTTPTAPAAPSNLTAAAVSATQVNLTWTDNSSNETGFKVYYSTDGTNYTLLATVGANVTAYSWTGAAPATTYSFRVTAANAVGESAASNTAIANTPGVPPAAPSNLVARAASNTQINLTWADNSNNEDGFMIEVSSDGVNFTQLATVGPNVTSYSDTGLLPLSTYYFRVRAYNAVGNSAYSNTASATTPLL